MLPGSSWKKFVIVGSLGLVVSSYINYNIIDYLLTNVVYAARDFFINTGVEIINRSKAASRATSRFTDRFIGLSSHYAKKKRMEDNAIADFVNSYVIKFRGMIKQHKDFSAIITENLDYLMLHNNWQGVIDICNAVDGHTHEERIECISALYHFSDQAKRMLQAQDDLEKLLSKEVMEFFAKTKGLTLEQMADILHIDLGNITWERPNASLFYDNTGREYFVDNRDVYETKYLDSDKIKVVYEYMNRADAQKKGIMNDVEYQMRIVNENAYKDLKQNIDKLYEKSKHQDLSKELSLPMKHTSKSEIPQIGYNSKANPTTEKQTISSSSKITTPTTPNQELVNTQPSTEPEEKINKSSTHNPYLEYFQTDSTSPANEEELTDDALLNKCVTYYHDTDSAIQSLSLKRTNMVLPFSSPRNDYTSSMNYSDMVGFEGMDNILNATDTSDDMSSSALSSLLYASIPGVLYLLKKGLSKLIGRPAYNKDKTLPTKNPNQEQQEQTQEQDEQQEQQSPDIENQNSSIPLPSDPTLLNTVVNVKREEDA